MSGARFWFLLSLFVFALCGCSREPGSSSYTVHGFSDRDYTTRIVEVDGQEYIIFDVRYSSEAMFVIPKESRKETGLAAETDFELLGGEGEISGEKDKSQGY